MAPRFLRLYTIINFKQDGDNRVFKGPLQEYHNCFSLPLIGFEFERDLLGENAISQKRIGVSRRTLREMKIHSHKNSSQKFTMVRSAGMPRFFGKIFQNGASFSALVNNYKFQTR